MYEYVWNTMKSVKDSLSQTLLFFIYKDDDNDDDYDYYYLLLLFSSYFHWGKKELFYSKITSFVQL